MQRCALYQKNLITAQAAHKGRDYTCPECLGVVRLKAGLKHQPHFFHLSSALSCRQHQKGRIHLALQEELLVLLKEEEPSMEHFFPEIGRIADVACLKTKKIFEIQYSPISLEEAIERCFSYESLGFEMVWILHEHTFNHKRLQQAERFLRTKVCYFSNFSEKGEGMVYDQLERLSQKRRLYKSAPFAVDLACCKKVETILPPDFIPLRERIKNWRFFHEGDIFDSYLKGHHKALFQPHSEENKGIGLLKRLRNFYSALFRSVLEKNC